jgi:hypothetical protein
VTSNFKDSPEVIEFRNLFGRLKDWTDDDPDSLLELARADEGILELGMALLRAAGSIQRDEQLDRELFTGPVDPVFLSEWRDFEERFASVLLSVRSDVMGEKDKGVIVSFEYYEQPDQWEIADFKALGIEASLDATIKFAQTTAESALKAAPGPDCKTLNANAFPEEVRAKFFEVAQIAGRTEDAYQELRRLLVNELRSSNDNDRKSTLRETLSKIEEEHLNQNEDGMPIEQVAQQTWAYWQALKDEAGLDLRGILRRRRLIPFTLFPRQVSARLSHTELPSIYQNLRQAHDAFVFGSPFAALALMRSVMEMVLRDHYGATGGDLEELINSVGNRLPKRANRAALHRLRILANDVLHGNCDRTKSIAETEKREFELTIISRLFVLRDLVERAPSFRAR